jgi:uncharacterized protein YccT (UPF0319 family)
VFVLDGRTMGQTVVSDRAEEYRRLGDECLQLANQLPAHQRENLMTMAQYWFRLAEQQERATHLGVEKD